jgi:hypothetical protein
MPKLILTGRSDVGEMALFDVDALPARRPDRAAIDALVAQGALLRVPRGADRACVLHVYLDEPVPDELMRYCSASDDRHGRLKLEHGRLGLGGVESAFAGFESNEAIRSDGVLTPGEYDATVCRAAVPDALVTNAMRAALSPQAKKHLAVPVQIMVVALAVMAATIFVKAWLAATVVALAAVGGLWMFYQHPATKQLRAQARAIELRYPSIVVTLRSASA